jgi:hypothetical protein
MAQKLSSSPRRVTRSAGTPISSIQMRSASSSEVCTVIQSFSFGIAKRSVRSVQAKRIASCLEVVAEAEVAEHLEEGVVPGRVADVLEIVVLAAGPHAALRADRAAYSRVSRPVNTSLNWTMPAFVNSRVGSFAGTSELLGTIS